MPRTTRCVCVYRCLSPTYKSRAELLAVPELLWQASFTKEFDEAIKYNDQLKTLPNKVQDDMNPLRVLQLFERVPDECRSQLNLCKFVVDDDER
ncbi:hypothetical protein CYMTET_8351 [Cymbomonas tetramitiformis]|uniref:Uncharacterized protein n=1 Tax=Cymbomonas tetramitiformis TaxID=36881 RepID=A0AAE0GTV8_9CHLO|nr:hypothetical protein CYMTET_8351 [Cymbomonas tetramitiformis]